MNDPFQLKQIQAYYYLYPHTEWSNAEMSKYITPNELVNLGFSLINNGYNENGDSYWITGKFKLYTNVLPLPNDCYWVGNKEQKEKAVGKWIDMGNSIKNVHLSDGKDGEITMVGKGEFPFDELIARLKDGGYDGPLIIEQYAKNYDSYDEVAESVKYLKNLLEA